MLCGMIEVHQSCKSNIPLHMEQVNDSIEQ